MFCREFNLFTQNVLQCLASNNLKYRNTHLCILAASISNSLSLLTLRLANLVRIEVFNLPDGEAGNAAHVRVKEL